VAKLDPGEIWATREKGRANLVSFIRSNFGEALLDPHALTIGFARRFATYKRATLLLSQPDRLRRLLLDADRPVQFVFAGKAHPADQPGKDMIREIEMFARQLDVGNRVVFLQDYDMAVARTMLHGCDVWLNNPRRPLEACGTSGMKAALNGVLNCSILDGWWDECYDGQNGWAIASADDDADTNRRDQREATSLFGLLEREIVPLFYDRNTAGVPVEWVNKMKDNWCSLGPFVTAARMVREYTSELYEPAAASALAMVEDNAARGKALAHWKVHVRESWPELKVVDLDIDTADAHEGDERTVRARVELGAIDEGDVTVQALHGPIDSAGAFINTPQAVILQRGDNGTFEGRYLVGEAGPYGVTVRAVPNNRDLINPMDMGLVAWAV
jgi:starch phosphorylase